MFGGSSGTSGTSGAKSTAARLAEYTLTAVNRGKQALKNVVLEHGPLPSGAVFDPSRSTQGCTQVGSSVQCTTDLQAGESKAFTLAYKVQNSVSCALAKALQTAKSSVNGITGSATSGVSTSITCSMKTEATAASASSASASLGNPAYANGAFGGSGTSLGAGYGSGAVTPGMFVGALGGKDMRQTGYKPYGNVRMPRTGAADVFTASAKEYILLPAHETSSEGSFPVMTTSLSMILLSIFGALILKRRLFG